MICYPGQPEFLLPINHENNQPQKMSIFKKNFVWNYPTCYLFHNYLFLAMVLIHMSWVVLDVTFTFICGPRKNCFLPSYGSIRSIITVSAPLLTLYFVSFILSIIGMITSNMFHFISLLFIQSIITIIHLVIFLLQANSRHNLYHFSFLVFHILYLVNICCVTFNQYMLQWMNYPLHTYFHDKTFIQETIETQTSVKDFNQ